MTSLATADDPTTLPADVRDVLVARFPAAAALPVRWQVETATRLDTGSWLRRAPVHAAVIGDRFVAVAPGPRPVVRHWPLAAVGKAVYNHVMGELVLPPGQSGLEPAFPLALDPLVARSLLALASPSAGTHSHA
jgi:hypothetical protein